MLVKVFNKTKCNGSTNKSCIRQKRDFSESQVIAWVSLAARKHVVAGKYGYIPSDYNYKEFCNNKLPRERIIFIKHQRKPNKWEYKRLSSKSKCLECNACHYFPLRWKIVPGIMSHYQSTWDQACDTWLPQYFWKIICQHCTTNKQESFMDSTVRYRPKLLQDVCYSQSCDHSPADWQKTEGAKATKYINCRRMSELKGRIFLVRFDSFIQHDYNHIVEQSFAQDDGKDVWLLFKLEYWHCRNDIRTHKYRAHQHNLDNFQLKWYVVFNVRVIHGQINGLKQQPCKTYKNNKSKQRTKYAKLYDAYEVFKEFFSSHIVPCSKQNSW